MPGSKEKPKKTIAEVLDEFLDEQQSRLSPVTFSRYESVINLLTRYCETYWPGHDGECNAVTKAGGTFCDTYGPEDIAGTFVMFLDYFMPY